MLQTTNYNLNKPEGSDVVDISVLNGNFDTIDTTMKTLDTKSATYAVTGGNANTYTATINGITSYFAGLRVCVQINTTSTGASTLNINGLGAKTILDSLGNQISNGGLKANIPYQLCYNGSNFIVLGKGGGGNATASQILLGKTATVDSGQITGTLDLSNLVSGNIKSGVTINGISGSNTVVDTADATVNAGQILNGQTAYVNGNKITGTIPNRGTYQYTGNIGSAYDGNNYLAFNNIPWGYYQSNNDGWSPEIRAKFSDVANAIGLSSDKLVSGQNILGINGSATVQSLGGYKVASGTTSAIAFDGDFYYADGTGSAVTSLSYVTVSGLTFTPKVILIFWASTTSGSYFTMTVFNSLINDGFYSPTAKISTYDGNNDSYYNTYNFKSDAGSAYVNSTGFCLPVFFPNSYTWYAFG